MLQKLLIISLLFFNLFASNEYEEGKKVFENKCASCHIGHISMNKLKENFFFENNKILNLKAPTVNMLAYAIIDGPKKIGDENDEEMRQIEIEEFLKSYLEKPDLFNSICDEHILKYYDKKVSMKDKISEDEYVSLSYFFLEYKKNNKSQKKEILESNFSEEKILSKAKKENKLIMVYATSKSCYYCKKMDKDVLSKEKVKKQINKNYIYLEVDLDKESLPFNLKEKYKKITPSFFVLDSNGQYTTQYPGSWTKLDFLIILRENIK